MYIYICRYICFFIAISLFYLLYVYLIFDFMTNGHHLVSLRKKSETTFDDAKKIFKSRICVWDDLDKSGREPRTGSYEPYGLRWNHFSPFGLPGTMSQKESAGGDNNNNNNNMRAVRSGTRTTASTVTFTH